MPNVSIIRLVGYPYQPLFRLSLSCRPIGSRDILIYPHIPPENAHSQSLRIRAYNLKLSIVRNTAMGAANGVFGRVYLL
jgi:hypothetical protein